MQTKQAKVYFSAGMIQGLEVQPAAMQKGWMVLVKARFLVEDEFLTTALGAIKVFSSLDTLFSQVEQITGRPVRGAALVV